MRSGELKYDKGEQWSAEKFGDHSNLLVQDVSDLTGKISAITSKSSVPITDVGVGSSISLPELPTNTLYMYKDEGGEQRLAIVLNGEHFDLTLTRR